MSTEFNQFMLPVQWHIIDFHFPLYIYCYVFSLSIPMMIHSIFTLPTHDLFTIDSDDLLTCFSSRIPFPRLSFPFTLPYSSWSVRRIRLSFVNFITPLLSSHWCTVSVFYSLTCMFAFLHQIGFLKSPFFTSTYQLGLKLFTMIHEDVTNVFSHIHSIAKRL